jgi:hypothetical protein
MKPRLRLIKGLWHCGFADRLGWWQIGPSIGLGYTPSQAYIDWKSYQLTVAAAEPSAAQS